MSSPSSRVTMFRQHSQRYHRGSLAKGLKVKHVLQIAVVIVVLTWVSYELNFARKPASSQGQGRSALQDTEQEASLGRKALKPEVEPGRFHLETGTDTSTDPDDTVTEASQEENFDGSRIEEDVDDQRDRDISELDIEHATDQDSEELTNEEARLEQELGENGKDGKDGHVDENSDSRSQIAEGTISDDASTEGGSDDYNHLARVVDVDKKASGATFMDAFNADSVLKRKLDKLDGGEGDGTSRENLDEKRDSATDALKETSEDSGQEVTEQKSADQNEDLKIADQNEEAMSQKDVEDEVVDTFGGSSESDTTKDNVNNQSEVEVRQGNLDTQPEEQSKKTEDRVETHEEGKVDETIEKQEQRQDSECYEAVKEQIQSQQQAGREDKPEEKLDTQFHVEEQEEKKQEEGVEKKADDTETQQETKVKDAKSHIQPELKSEGADVEVEKKTDESPAVLLI